MEQKVIKRRFRFIPKDISIISVALYAVVMPPFLLVMSTLLVVYVFPQKAVPSKAQVKGASTQSTSTISFDSMDDIGSWETFVSKKWHFSFKYPSIFDHHETLFGNSSGKQIEVSVKDVIGPGNSVPYFEIFIMKGADLKEIEQMVLENPCTNEVVYEPYEISGTTYLKASLILNNSCDAKFEKKVAYGFYLDEKEKIIFVARNIELETDTFEEVVKTVVFTSQITP